MEKNAVEADVELASSASPWYSILPGDQERNMEPTGAVQRSESMARTLPSSINPIIIDVVMVLLACLSCWMFYVVAEQSCLFSYVAATSVTTCAGPHQVGGDFLSFSVMATAPAALFVCACRAVKLVRR